MQSTLSAVQRALEPAGLAARNVSECLALQLQAAGHGPDSLPVRLLDHLTDLARGNRQTVINALATDEAALAEALALIARLPTRPIDAAADTPQAAPIIPELRAFVGEGQALAGRTLAQPLAPH